MKISSILKALLLSLALGLTANVWAAIDINSANMEELQQLKGIGAKKAADIIAYREAHGSFKSADELLNIKGIGKATLEKLRDEIVVNAEEAATGVDKKAAGKSKKTAAEPKDEAAVATNSEVSADMEVEKADEGVKVVEKSKKPEKRTKTSE